MPSHPEIDMGKVLLAVIAKLGEVTITKQEFLRPMRDGVPIGSVKMKLHPDQEAITLVPVTEEETARMLVEGLMTSMLNEITPTGKGH